ncbi:MAG: type II toxin-antitoxin system RelE/ParE family toxin [Bacteroidota bacterium]
MSYNVKSLAVFERQAKGLIKKYPSLKKEILELVNSLKENPKQGSPIGNHCYKIRLAIASKGKGKSGGARVITYLKILHSTVFLLSIFDKSEKETISDKDLASLIKDIPNK